MDNIKVASELIKVAKSLMADFSDIKYDAQTNRVRSQAEDTESFDYGFHNGWHGGDCRVMVGMDEASYRSGFIEAARQNALANAGIKKFYKKEVRYAGAGMSDSAFNARVRKALDKLAKEYGGKRDGYMVFGTTEDGLYWSAAINRINASNGECVGVLRLYTKDANGKVQVEKSAFNWDYSFEKLGIHKKI